MADITFSPYLAWVDATDPANIPPDARTITAADLLRYEVFGRDAAAAINANTAAIANLPTLYAAKSVETSKANATDLAAHTGNTANPHAVTKAQVGLGAVDNTADTAKPVSTAQATAIGKTALGVIASTGPISTSLTGIDGPSWYVAALLNTSLVSGRWYRVKLTTAQVCAAEANMAFAVLVRKSATTDATSAGTDIGDSQTHYTAPTSGYGKTTNADFVFKATATETVNLKVVVSRASGAATFDLNGRIMSVFDEGAQI